jgi:hypothetical protein
MTPRLSHLLLPFFMDRCPRLSSMILPLYWKGDSHHNDAVAATDLTSRMVCPVGVEPKPSGRIAPVRCETESWSLVAQYHTHRDSVEVPSTRGL